jgi:energy-coupling factor transport system substrate-specific component
LGGLAWTTEDRLAAPSRDEMTAPRPTRSPGPLPTTLVVTLVPAAAALDIVGGMLNSLLGLPTYLDTIGTCVAAIVLGPWWGALTGILANIGGAVYFGPTNIPFGLANALAALMWGYGVRTFLLGRNPYTYFGLNAAVGVATGAVGALIALVVFGGTTGHASDAITAALTQAGEALREAVLTSSVLTSLGDKIISGFVGLAIVRALPGTMTEGLVLPGEVGMRSLLLVTLGTVLGVGVVLVSLQLG